MADISDAFGAFALGTLGKAAGQDFLSPMLNDVRQKDMLAFQRRQAEEARDRERKMEHAERTASRKNLLGALQAAGAVRPVDIVAAGGVDAISEMDDTDFVLLQQSLQRNRLQDLSDEEQVMMAKAAAGVRGIYIPETVGKEEAINLLAQSDYYDLQKKETEAARQDSYNAMNSSIEASAQAIEQMFAQELNITGATVGDAVGRVGLLRTQLNNADLDPRRRPELEARLSSLEQRITMRGPAVVANQISSLGPSAQFTAYASILGKDPEAANLALQRPGMVANVTTVERNYNALRVLPESAVANNEALKQAKAAAMASDSVTELLKDPSAAYSVFKADVGTATVRAADEEKRAVVRLQAEGIIAGVSNLASIGGPWAMVARDLEQVTADSLITGDAGQYDLNPSPVVNAVAERLKQAIDSAFLPGKEDLLLDIQTQIEEMESTPLGKELRPLVMPFLTEAQREMFDRMEPDSYALTEKMAGRGVKQMQYGAENVLYRSRESDTGEVFNPEALKRIEEGGATILSADLRASRAHLENSKEGHKEAQMFATLTGNRQLAKTALMAETELQEAEERQVFREQSAGLFTGAMGALYEAGRGGATKEETVDAVASSLAASVNRLFQEYGMASDIPTEIGDDLRAAVAKGDSIAEATLEYVRANRQMFAQAAQTKGKAPVLEQEINYRIAEWEQVIANLPEIEESKAKSYRRFLAQSGYANASLTNEIAPNDYLLGLIARRAR